MSEGLGEFTKRTLTGAVYVALTLGAALAGPWTTFMLFLPVCIIGAKEWHFLFNDDRKRGLSPVTAMLLAGVAFIAFSMIPLLHHWRPEHAAAVILFMLLLVAFQLMHHGVSDPAQGFAGHLAAVFYVALPFASVTFLADRGWHVFIGFMFLLWTSDTGAYLVGRAIGRTKLMPAVSPGKTWEGLAGGVALTIAVGWLLVRHWPELSRTQWMAGAAVVAFTATLGDLLESAFKRARGVKDSGSILPGHGGILDRFDGFLLAAPAMLLVIRLVT